MQEALTFPGENRSDLGGLGVVFRLVRSVGSSTRDVMFFTVLER